MAVNTQFDTHKPVFSNAEQFYYYLRKLHPIERRQFIIDNREHYKAILGEPNFDWAADINFLRKLLQEFAREIGDDDIYEDQFRDLIKNRDRNKIIERLEKIESHSLAGLELVDILSVHQLENIKTNLHDDFSDRLTFNEAFNKFIRSFYEDDTFDYRNAVFGTRNKHARKFKEDKWTSIFMILDNYIDDRIEEQNNKKIIENIVEDYIDSLQKMIDAGFPLSQERLNDFEELIRSIDITFDSQTEYFSFKRGARKTAAMFNGSKFRITLLKPTQHYQDEGLKFAIFHELTHFLSACNLIPNSILAGSGFHKVDRKYLMKKTKKDNSGKEYFRLSNRLRNRAKTSYNEAITDTIACWAMMKDNLPDFKNMTGKDFFNPTYSHPTIGYPSARIFCREILANMPIFNMIKAYFEDYHSLNKPGKRSIYHRAHSEDFAKHVKGGYDTFKHRWNTWKIMEKKKNIPDVTKNMQAFLSFIKPITIDWHKKLEELGEDYVLVNGHSRKPKIMHKEETPAFKKHGQNTGEPIRINGKGIAEARVSLSTLAP